MNIALEKTEEYVNGSKRRTYGDAFVRGNNGKVQRKTRRGVRSVANHVRSYVYLGRLKDSRLPESSVGPAMS